MRRHVTLLLSAVLAALPVTVLLSGCAKLDRGPTGQNIEPDTKLTFAPDDGDTTSWKVALTWSGADPDGEVVCYWTSVDSSAWRRTVATETLLILPVDECDSGDEVLTVHVFAVRAEDDTGDRDPTPAVVTFTSRNSLPETEIVTGPASVTGPMVFFEWRGWDYDGIIASYGWELYRWEVVSAEWFLVAERNGIPPDEVSVWFGPVAGRHRFEVWSVDDAGALDATPAAWEFMANPALAGPKLWIQTSFMGTHVFRAIPWAPTYNIPTDIFGGEELVFDWTASAEDYGGLILGFSYAFDDTSNWCSSYSLDETHFDIVPTPGEHSLYVSVIDNAAVETRGRIFVNVSQMTREYVLVVDDWDYREHLPQWGTDEKRDAFYDTLTMACSRPIVLWDVEEHLVNGIPSPPDVPTMAGASTIVWYYDTVAAGMDQAADPFLAEYLTLAGYVRAGGNLVLCGRKGLTQIMNGEPYPIAFTSSDTTPSRVFVRDQLGIGFVDNSGGAINKNTPWTYGYCFYGAVAGETSVPELGRSDFGPVYIDSVGPGGYPEPGKWPVYTWGPPWNEGYWRGGLPYVEKLQAYQGEGMEVSVIDAYLNINYEGEPCIMLRHTGTDQGNTCYFGFPLYYTQTDQAVAFFERLYELFGE